MTAVAGEREHHIESVIGEGQPGGIDLLHGRAPGKCGDDLADSGDHTGVVVGDRRCQSRVPSQQLRCHSTAAGADLECVAGRAEALRRPRQQHPLRN